MWPLILLVLGAFIADRYIRGKALGDADMLAFGAILYIVLPFIAFDNEWLFEMPGVESWRDLFGAAEHRSFQIAGLSLGLAIVYQLGRIAAIAASTRIGSTMNRPLSKSMQAMVAVGLWTIWLLTALPNRESFFQGYLIDYDTGLMGTLATINLIALATVLGCRQYRLKGVPYGALRLLLLINSIALLSLGGRLYVVIPVIALMLQSLADTKPTASRLRGAVGFLFIVIALLVVGALRIDEALSAEFLAYIGLAEGLFTSMSLGSFVNYNGIPILSTPENFFGSIVNFIPSTLIADKAALVPTIQDSGRFFESPLGATHILVALLGNFGWLGALFFACAFGWFMASVRQVAPRGWWLYFYLCSLLPFMLFRDGFAIFNKAAIWNGCILMWFIFTFDRMMALRPASRPRRARNPCTHALIEG